MQRRQALLAVDQRALVDVRARRQRLVAHDRPEKVRRQREIGPRRDEGLDALHVVKKLYEVLPQLSPLILLVPHVSPLEDRHHVLDVRLKDPQKGPGVGLHRASMYVTAEKSISRR